MIKIVAKLPVKPEYIDAFKEGGEKVTLIESDYEETIKTVLEELHPRNTSSITA